MPDPTPPAEAPAPALPTQPVATLKGADELYGLGRLFAKIAFAQATMPALTRDRTVTVTMKSGGSYSYDYVTEDQITSAMRRHLAAQGVATFVAFTEAHEIGSGDGGENVVRVKVVVVYADGETGATFRVEGWGDGTDRGDKAIGKAQTSGLRVLLGKNLLQAGGDDGESANPESARQGMGQAGRSADGRPATEGQISRVFGLSKSVDWMHEPGSNRVAQAAVYDLCRWVTRGDEKPADGPNSLDRDQVQRVFNVLEAMAKEPARGQQVASAIDDWLTSMGAGEEPQAPPAASPDDQIPFASDTPGEDGYGG